MAHELRGISLQAVGPSRGEIYAFGPVRIDVARHLVMRDGQPIVLAPGAVDARGVHLVVLEPAR
jgi:hypothetical protein